MSNLFTSLVLASLIFPTSFNFFAASQSDFPFNYIFEQQQAAPQRVANNSFGLELTAGSAVVVDKDSNALLYSKNPGAVSSVASITKLMTALVFLETKPNWDEPVEILSTDLREGGVTRLVPGERVTKRQLFNIMLVASANEAAIALARTSGLPDFVAAMNNKAYQLNMWQTVFVEPSGLDPQNVSRSIDLIKLANAAFDHPEITAALQQREYKFTTSTGRQGVVESTDELLDSFLNEGDYKIIGAKTGYLDEAQYCLLTQVQNAQGKTLTVVLLGSASQQNRWQEVKGLVDWTFNNYLWPTY